MFKKEKPLLEVGPVWTKIIKKTDSLYAALDAAETTVSKDSHGVYNLDFSGFLSGLVPYVVRHTDAGYYSKNDANLNVNPLPLYLDRPYQRDAVNAALDNKRGILQLPTGSGKSRIAVAIMDCVRGRWLYLAPKGNLVDSTAEQFKRLTNEDVGILHGSTKDYLNKRVICATYDSAYSDANFYATLQTVDGIIADEAHNAPADTRFAVLLAAQKRQLQNWFECYTIN
jgi:superfamily II DNA or RNA helicase